MYVLIRYPVGIIVEAVVLSVGRSRMRVAAAGFPDAIELRHSGTQWFVANHEPVEFDFLMSNVYTEETVSRSKTAQAARVISAATH